jgi:hypothetical protein
MKAVIYATLGLACAGSMAAAEHPTVLLASTGKVTAPVVALQGTDPIIEVNGKPKRLDANVPITAERAPYYADGHVELSGVSLAGFSLQLVATASSSYSASHNAPIASTSFFEADMIADREIHGGFVAIIAYNPEFIFGLTDQPSAQILLHDLPTLTALVPTHVKFTAPGIKGGKFLVMVFAAGGAEVATNADGHVAEYFTRLEKVRLAQAVARYRAEFRTTDHAAAAFVRIAPRLPPGTSPPSAPLTATLSVGDDGVVSFVHVDGTEDADLTGAIRDAMEGWLFLPRLKGGVPVASRVAIPVVFSSRGR